MYRVMFEKGQQSAHMEIDEVRYNRLLFGKMSDYFSQESYI